MSRLSRMSMLSMIFTLASCQIEPPLKLAQAQKPVTVDVPVVITDLDVVWSLDINWETEWRYGWDADDEALWGKLEYPTPETFEVRRYFTGEAPADSYITYDGFSITGHRFRRQYDFGYYNMLLYSDVVSDDEVQSLVMNESDPQNIIATTSAAPLGYSVRSARNLHQPEIFYSGYEKHFYISHNVEDYDYFDEKEQVWVKHLKMELNPMVYIYLVQVVLHNNKGRVTGLDDDSSISGLADAVNVNTAVTSETDANVVFPMRLKRGVRWSDTEQTDILGGKLTTFGLCGMQGWSRSKASRAQYAGTRMDVTNTLSLNFSFSNYTQKVLTFDITKQMQRQCHGGIITVEIDVNDIEIPPTPEGGQGSAFNPVVDEDMEEVNNDFVM